MEQEDRIDIYTIPPNFAEEGTLLSGRIKTRNAVETGVLLLVLVPILLSLNTTVRIKMYIGMIVLVPVVILSVIGVQGESLFAFIGSFFQYVNRRRYLAPPDERYRMEQNRRKKRLLKEKIQKEKFRKEEGQRPKRKNGKGKQEMKEGEKRDGHEERDRGSRQGMEKLGGQKTACRAETEVETGTKTSEEGFKERKEKPGRPQGGKRGEKGTKEQKRCGGSKKKRKRDTV